MLASAGFLVACGEPLERRDAIERPRVLGARVEVESDPSRAWPGPGEAASLRLLVVEPAAPRARSWALVACPMAPVRTGAPQCDGDVFARRSGTSPEEPSFTFTVPDAIESRTIAVFGAVCTEGQLIFSREGLPVACEPGGDDATVLTAEIPIWLEGVPNANPSLADATWEFDGAPLGAPDSARAPGGACTASDELPLWSSADGSATLDLGLGDDPREPLDANETAIGAPRETLQLSHFATAGRLERPVTFIESTDDAFPEFVSLGWKPPRTIPEDGSVVRFVTVARDGRGGSDWTVRDLCLLP